MASQDTEWKDKFKNLSIEFESLERTTGETQKIFCRTLIRLAMSVKGLDTALDPYISRIHDVVKKDCGPGIRKKLDELSDQMIRAADAQKAQDPFERFIEHFSVSKDDQKRAITLWKQMVSSPADVTERMINELVEILGGKPVRHELEKSKKKSGLLSRLFSSDVEQPGSEPDHPDNQPNRILKEVLGDLDWPNSIKPEVYSLIGKLDENASDDMWIRVLSSVNDILVDALSSFQSEVQSAEKFLAELSSRLQEIDGFVQTARAMRSESLQSGRALGKTMTEQVDGISSSMQQATDLEVLKSTVAQKLDVIQSHVSDHLESEEQRHTTTSQREEELKAKFADLESEAQGLREQIEEARIKAVRDAVTGLPNRQAYDERIQQEYSRWKRFGDPLALMVWDIDDFKKINDTYGHQSGDKALRALAEKLKTTLRETDFIARYGGEEFVVLLVGTDLDGAKEAAEKMRARIEKVGLKANGEIIRMTVSGGISMFQQGDAPQDVFERADQALYKAKGNGKNQCIVG
jgi:diguanylate cyclase